MRHSECDILNVIFWSIPPKNARNINGAKGGLFQTLSDKSRRYFRHSPRPHIGDVLWNSEPESRHQFSQVLWGQLYWSSGKCVLEKKALKRITQNTPRKGAIFGQMGEILNVTFWMWVCQWMGLSHILNGTFWISLRPILKVRFGMSLVHMLNVIVSHSECDILNVTFWMWHSECDILNVSVSLNGSESHSEWDILDFIETHPESENRNGTVSHSECHCVTFWMFLCHWESAPQ